MISRWRGTLIAFQSPGDPQAYRLATPDEVERGSIPRGRERVHPGEEYAPGVVFRGLVPVVVDGPYVRHNGGCGDCTLDERRAGRMLSDDAATTQRRWRLRLGRDTATRILVCESCLLRRYGLTCADIQSTPGSKASRAAQSASPTTAPSSPTAAREQAPSLPAPLSPPRRS